MKELSTDLDREQKERNDPEFTSYFWKNLALAVGIALIIALGIIFTLLNKQVVDSIEPHIQLLIAMVFLGGYGIIRMSFNVGMARTAAW